MKLDLPSPATLREEKKRSLKALLDAEIYLPNLVERLSVCFMHIDTETASRWAGWIQSLQADPAWPIIEPALTMPEAWPDVWERARQAGFSQKTEHHQAIFFVHLFERAVEATRFELARTIWEQALLSWANLAEGDFLDREALGPMADELSDKERSEVVASLLNGPIAMLGDMAIESLRLPSWEAPPARRSLRFTMKALGRAREVFENVEDSPLAGGVTDGVELMRHRLHRSLTDEIDRQIQELDLTTTPREDFLEIFDGALRRAEYMQPQPEIDRALLRRGLGIIWDLRETGRDEEIEIIAPMVERLKPCTERLEEAGGDDFFGLEGAVADLLVFEGEDALAIEHRQEAFEEALRICPKHRNASRLLSYLLLERANRHLLKTAALPDATARVGPFRRRIQPLIDRASEAIDRAAELYPDNELLDRYRADLAKEIKRFKLVTEEVHED